jgi:hypothetical protein
MTEFQATLESWHDFYLAVGSASAALLGLLFVGVSINLSAISAAERVDLRTRANQAFSNLLYMLALSLIVLIPGMDPASLAISFAFLAGMGMIRLSRRIVGLVRSGAPWRRRLATLRRMSWTLLADVALLLVARAVASDGNARSLPFTTVAVFVLLVGSADIAWDMMVRESDEADQDRGTV